MENGKHDLNRLGAIALISEYDTKPVSEGFIEFHRKFIDVQIVIRGREKIGIANKINCRELEYDEEKDLGRLEGQTDFISLDTDNFVIFFPQDGHMPQISCSDKREKVKKVVFKIPLKP